MNAKLTPEQANAVANDPRAYTVIGAQYGVSAQTVCNVKKKLRAS